MILNIQLGDIGLIIDLLGAILLFIYGLAPLITKDGSISLSVGISDYLKRKAKRYELLSRFGMLLIVIGFAFQLLGNHISWSMDISLTVVLAITVLLLLIVIATYVVKHYWKRKYDLCAYYIPQFDELKPSHTGEHMWNFTITNNSRKVIKQATLCLSGKPRTAVAIISGEEPRTLTASSKIKIENILLNQTVIIRVWNIAGYIEAGLDCYLEIEDKIIHPKVFYFDKKE